jgi:hypothetical protein
MIYSQIIDINCKGNVYSGPDVITKYNELTIKIFDSDPYMEAVVYFKGLAIADLLIGYDYTDKYYDVVGWTASNYDELMVVAKEKSKIPRPTFAEFRANFAAKERAFEKRLGIKNDAQLAKIKTKKTSQ